MERILLLLLLPAMTSAGVVFVAPENVSSGEEEYAPSEFGKAPVHPLRYQEEYDDAMLQPLRMPDGRAIASVDKIKTRQGAKSEPVKALIPNRRKGVQEVALIAGDLGFFPKTVFVTRDVPVRLFVTGASKSTLCIMMDTFNVRRQIRTNRIEEIYFTPKTPGTYRFYCPVNGMEGVMVVRELASKKKKK